MYNHYSDWKKTHTARSHTRNDPDTLDKKENNGAGAVMVLKEQHKQN